MTLPERGLVDPTVSLGALLRRDPVPVDGATDVSLEAYVEEILASGFPGLRALSGRPLRAELDGYLTRIAEREFPLMGRSVRNPFALGRWMAAYAAATATTATFETIRDAAAGGDGEKPSRTTVMPYHDILTRLWIVEPLPAWYPGGNVLRRLSGPAKHHLADPALAARLLNVGAGALLSGRSSRPVVAGSGTLLGALFESLVCLSVRVFAQASEARVSHFRTKGGEREVDLIVEASDHRVLAIEVKLGRVVTDDDTRHLRWLKAQLGDDLVDMIVVSTGDEAYRRPDDVAVVPLALLGP
jgi:predicted AAA+ superfamily ATPase